jgi:hypothetical protein
MSLEDQLRELMEYRPSTGTPLSADQLIRRFRRNRTRRNAIGAGACAVVLALRAGTFTVVNQSPTTNDTSATRRPTLSIPQERSPVLTVAPEQQFTVTAGFKAWLTSQGVCSETGSAFDGLPEATPRPTSCAWFVTPGTLTEPGPRFTSSETTVDGKTGQRWLLIGAYMGSTIPAAITVTFDHSQTTYTALATIVTSDSLPGNYGFYAVLPYVQVFPSATATASAGQSAPSAPEPNANYTAYDAKGQVITTTAFHA